MRPLPQHWRIDGSEGEATARSIAISVVGVATMTFLRAA